MIELLEAARNATVELESIALQQAHVNHNVYQQDNITNAAGKQVHQHASLMTQEPRTRCNANKLAYQYSTVSAILQLTHVMYAHQELLTQIVNSPWITVRLPDLKEDAKERS